MLEAIQEAIWVEILARLPLRSIARFKSVCKNWKSVIESSYFRRLFISLHRNSSSSWSLMFESSLPHPITEAIGFHGCKKWDLPKPPSSYIMPLQRYPNLPASKFRYVASSNGLVLIEAIPDHSANKSFVGNPVLQQWVEIPPLSTSTSQPVCPVCLFRTSGLVTRVEEDGLVSSFKVLTTCEMFRPREKRVYVYSSETGLWTFKRLVLNKAGFSPTENHSGVHYTWESDSDDFGQLEFVAHDFYGPEDDDQWRVLTLPPLPSNRRPRRCLTASRGGVVCMEVLDRVLKVWKLKDSSNSDGECWHLSREAINMASVGFDVDCSPLGANPFDSDMVYLWSLQHGCLVSGNLQKQEFAVCQESDISSSSAGSWVVNTLDSKGCMESFKETSVLMLSQFVLLQWMGPVPRPPN
ncbi:unnamed protein product [Microthlaspi erraticum]|uniref:F-box domain-containing protein n=1 Tax=Microthlaspi erraticum TaxID=1685480 RepID=A0A6D2IWH0_9BRAS|nr:unnamed protein product [Microthlaspi erraticum]